MQSEENGPIAGTGGAAANNKIQVEVTAWDLINLAVKLEKAGVEFYRMLSEDMEDSKVRAFFLRLMGMEIDHERKLREVLAGLTPTEESKRAFDEDLSAREYFIQIRTMVLAKVFPDSFDFLEEIQSFKTPSEAFPLAIRIEENALALYQLLGRFQLTPAATGLIESLIAEETSHLSEVTRIFRSISRE